MEIKVPDIDSDQHKLAANGILDLLEVVVDGGADINAKDASGMSPLLWSVKNGHEDVAKCVLFRFPAAHQRSQLTGIWMRRGTLA